MQGPPFNVARGHGLMTKVNESGYAGFEQGPIRPPSEAQSLLIRVSRNCPWNRCTFCPVYKGERFSVRPVAHVMEDIEAVHEQLARIHEITARSPSITPAALAQTAQGLTTPQKNAFYAALNWYCEGMESIFLQDANSLIIKPADLIAILEHIRRRFPWVKRITSYARSHTVARIADQDLAAMQQAGLSRIHIGMESGSDAVLEKVCKGTTKAQHVKAGIKVRQAGIELSEYIMPGLGGVELSTDHARESADALNQINPHFIRLRTLAIPPGTPLFDDFTSGRFVPMKDAEVAAEVLLFIESLNGITSTIKSDHILNLFEDLEGRMPQDKEKMARVVRSFLEMDPRRRTLYQVGRRVGVFRGLEDMSDPRRLAHAQGVVDQYGITPENVDQTIIEIMRRFV